MQAIRSFVSSIADRIIGRTRGDVVPFDNRFEVVGIVTDAKGRKVRDVPVKVLGETRPRRPDHAHVLVTALEESERIYAIDLPSTSS